MLLSCRPSRRARSVLVVCATPSALVSRARRVCMAVHRAAARAHQYASRFLRAARPIARPGPGERAWAARGPAAPHAAERVATVVHPSTEWARARRRAAPRLSSCCRGAAAPRHRCAASGSAAGGGERAMRCRERAAFGEAPTSRTRPGTPSFHPDGALAWAGPPGAWSGPPGETRQVYRPGEYDCTALSVQLRHQGRLTCSGERRRGPRNHEDGRIDGVARPGDVLPRAAVGKSTRGGAAPPNCTSRTRGRRSSGGYIIK